MIRFYVDCLEKMLEFCGNHGFYHKDYYALKELIVDTDPEKIITVLQIKKIIAHYFGITVAELVSKNRHKRVRFPRQFAHYYCLLLTEELVSEIGRKVGMQGHPNVLNSRKKIRLLAETKYPKDDLKCYLELEILFTPFIIKKRETRDQGVQQKD